MEGMGRKRAVVHALMSHDEQDGCQRIGESESERPQERFQIEHHQGQEEEERGVVGPSVDTMEPEGEDDERNEQEQDIAVDGTFNLLGYGIIRRGTAIPYCDDEKHNAQGQFHREAARTAQQVLQQFLNHIQKEFQGCQQNSPTDAARAVSIRMVSSLG